MGRRKKMDTNKYPSHYKNLVMSTKLIKNDKSVLVSLKEQILTITFFKSDGVIYKNDVYTYAMGDMALWKYCYNVKMLEMKGYKKESELSNFESVIKLMKKG
ncbi:MAG: hypothetical protein WC175_04155 [Candidatus Dojkabacteria bacterium]